MHEDLIQTNVATLCNEEICEWFAIFFAYYVFVVECDVTVCDLEAFYVSFRLSIYQVLALDKYRTNFV